MQHVNLLKKEGVLQLWLVNLDCTTAQNLGQKFGAGTNGEILCGLSPGRLKDRHLVSMGFYRQLAAFDRPIGNVPDWL
jgi:hypothetical protein